MRYLTFLIALLAASAAHAQSDPLLVVAEGVVPDQATKSLILGQLHELYGRQRVVDRLQVESIPAPPNWGRHVARMLAPGIRRVANGKLEVDGQSVRISGQVANEAQRQQVASELSLASNSTYTVTNSLETGGGQGLLDATLGDRIIEFESGSARLTDVGRAILDEMAGTMREIGDARVQVVGHTDNVGQRQSNIALSHARADAVRDYLVEQGIARRSLSVLGKGPDEPIADNATVDGRARNRRIQFRVL